MEVKDLTVRFGGQTVLDRVSLTIPDEGLTYLSGPSGVGKTTLLRVLAGLLEPDGGRVSVPGRAVMLFQADRLFPGRNALEQVKAVLPKAGGAEKFLELVELSEDGGKLPQELSGGMARRCALARCLAVEADAYLLDEPFAGVDPDRAKRILTRLTALGKPMVLTGHDPTLAEQSQRVIELR